jgi:putative spermidine/putrescine transport system substrate-binding protein
MKARQGRLGAWSRVVLTGAVAVAGVAWAQNPLVIDWYPGLLGSNMKQSFVDTYDQKASIRIVDGFDSARFTQMQANRASPKSDVAAFTDLTLSLVGKSGLLEPLDVKRVPNLADVDPSTRVPQDFGVPFTYGCFGLLYNAKFVKQPLRSWGDLLRADLKGRVSGPNITYTGAFNMLGGLASLKGADIKNPEEAMKLAREIRQSGPGLWDQESVAVGWLKTGEIWATPYFSGNALAMMRDPDLKDLQFVVPAEGAFIVPLNLAKVKGGPNVAGVDRFINHALSVSSQETWARLGNSRPVNTKAKMPAEVEKSCPTANRLKSHDLDYLNANRSKLVDMWNQVVNR